VLLRVQLGGGRYGYRCIPRGAGSLLVVAGVRAHRIVVQSATDGRGLLVDRSAGGRFVPRGASYIRLGFTSDGQSGLYHTTFDTDAYQPARADRVLARMHADGFNTVRVFLNGSCSVACLGKPGGSLRSAYVANLVDFLRRAKANRMFVIVTMDYLPWVGRYGELVPHIQSEYPSWQNTELLLPKAVEANDAFFRELAQRLLADDAPMDALLAYELRSEVALNWDAPPLSDSSGLFTAANGRSYDLSDPEAKRALVTDGMVTFIDDARSAIRSVDPSALVTIGFANVGARPFDEARAAIRYSSADFVDDHYYPNQFQPEASFAEEMASYGITGQEQKPIVMGEFGAFRHAYPTAASAADALVALQRESCAYGIAGWLLWTWDTSNQPDPLWNALDDNGALERALAPTGRPDPCAG
jgi:Cellulase (glycosyl hydrolase family 5)